MRSFIVLFIMLAGSLAGASTFVGNGGNAGDVELQVTINQVQQTLVKIAGEKSENLSSLCVCSSQFQGRSFCELLKKLNEEQVRFCSQYIREKAPQLSELLRQKEDLKFSWTHEVIDIQEAGHLRGVDAVTNAQNKSMTLNLPRYLSMSDVDRVFLMSHEVFHFTAYNGKNLTDEGDTGPFRGPDGGRQFINAMAAALVMRTFEYDLFDKYRGAINRSKGHKRFWLQSDILVQTTENKATSPYYVNQHTGARFGFRYQLTDAIGFLGEYGVLQGDKSVLSTIKGKETNNVLSAGIAYRWFPFENPLTFSGQSHLIFRGKVDFIEAAYQLSDPYVGLTEKTSSKGATLDCSYFIPFAAGLWGFATAGYSLQNYRYDQLNLEYNINAFALSTGVSYGF